MCTVSLSACLSNNYDRMGENGDLLGKTQGSALNQYRLFLSHGDNGWELKCLNILQLFFRCLGFYSSTHSYAIHSAFKNEIAQGNEKVVFNTVPRIKQLWQRQYFKEIGNANRSDANIFVFPEKHDDEVYHKSVGDFISEQYRNGDVVLVEGLESNLSGKIHTWQQGKYFRDNINVHGWEPENLSELQSGGEKTIIESEIRKLMGMINCQFPKDMTNTQEVTHFSEVFSAEYGKIAERLGVKHKYTAQYFNTAAQVTSQKKYKIESLRYVYSLSVDLLRDQCEKMEYTGGLNDVNKLLEDMVPRNHSLSETIEKWRKAGKRVFVLAGELHIFRRPELDHFPWLDEVHGTLQKHKYVVFANRERFENAHLATLNQNLMLG